MPRARFYILDAYPREESSHHARYASAVVSCWIAEGACPIDERRAAHALATGRLEAAGWMVASTVADHVVSETTYEPKRAGRSRFRQAMQDGIVFDVARQPRERVRGRVDLRVCRRQYASSRTFYSLFDGTQYANGVLASENELVPLWCSATDAMAWVPYWRGFEVVRLSRARARRLCAVAMDPDAFLYVAIGSDTGLVTFHPAEVSRAIAPA